MNIERGFRFVFQERNWFGKIIVGGVMMIFSFLIIPLLIYYGYLVEVAKRTIKEEQQLLPEWDEIGRKLANGFKLAVIIIVYLIPFFILFGISLPFSTLEFENFKSREIITYIMPLPPNLFLKWELTGISFLLFLSSLVYIILFALILPFIIGKFAENESINDAFAISDIFSMFRDNIGDAIIVFLLTIFLQLLASLGFVLCFVGILLTGFWASIVQYYLYGELYKKAKTTKV
ncbi:DUF4013 domain-containing protein [Candidatus Kryptobacter tengchongensis]|uniref:DUF4013 domain-containing protein n=1 Tax=Kryptobacter tengchongensis TaxID=1643429 RepID=A0A656D2A7_KRYT1|nr:DUF4013 domain-containing protein [Candidatus Kryptobacter tengchongensis]CUS97465.1 Protein of unknown function (DUF4013) [Candidatus Kryptobacter tengchongensis]